MDIIFGDEIRIDVIREQKFESTTLYLKLIKVFHQTFV